MAPIPAFAAIVILCIALFLLSFFSGFLRRHRSTSPTTTTTLPITITTPTPTTASPRAAPIRGGLDKTVIDTFPIFNYFDVALTLNRVLECYVCLNEFDRDETLRLIPVCHHAFHVECIDAWLSENATCPVCRANLHGLVVDQNDVVLRILTVDSDHHQDPPPRRHRPPVLPKLRRTLTWRSVSSTRFAKGLTRSKSMGRVAVNMERFTFRVPEQVIVAGNKLRRSRSTVFDEEGRWRRWRFTRSKSMVVPEVTSP